MRPTRRAVFCGAGALALAGRARAAQPAPVVIAEASVALGPDAPPATMAAFDGGPVGPELRGVVGAPLSVDLTNRLRAPVAIRTFGLRGLHAQVDLAPGATGTLRAVSPDAGTFWYAAEDRTDPRARPLVGALIVEEPEDAAPQTDRDLALVLDVWGLDGRGAPVVPPFAAARAAPVVNGMVELVEPAHPGERIRLRLVNAAAAHVFRPRLVGWRGWLVALDGQPLDRVSPAEGLALAPGQRADLIADVPPEEGSAPAIIDDAAPEAPALATFIADGEPLDPLTEPPAPLRANPIPTADPSSAVAVTWAQLASGEPVEVPEGATLRLRLDPSLAAELVEVEGAVMRRAGAGGDPATAWRNVMLTAPGDRLDLIVAPMTAGLWRVRRETLGGARRYGVILVR